MSSPKIVIVDYGMGNLRSVAQAVRKAAPEATVEISSDAQTVRSADRVVFPGQGAMPDCMRELQASGLEAAVRDAIANKPTMGLCVGMQMLFDRSYEGPTNGLGVFKGEVIRFDFGANLERLKIPHMGWNEVTQVRAHPVLKSIPSGERFYHVHSFYCAPTDASLTVTTTAYTNAFVSAVAKDNVFCSQFHPEKSGAAGLRVFRNFVDWQP